MQNNNGNNGTSQKDVEQKIGERLIKKTTPGLDEIEVRSYVDQLITQRDSLQKRQEHISALKELAEKTVIEANSLSQLLMQKATDQAKVEADKIRTKAEQDCETILREERAKVKQLAVKEAEDFKIETEKQMASMREEQMKSIKTEAAALAQKFQNELLTSIDNITRNVLLIGANFEKEPVTKVKEVTTPVKIEKKPESALSDGEKGALLDHIPWLEIEILPPLDIEKVMALISRLEELPEVKTTDLLPETPNPLIRVFLNEPSPLAELLRTLPQVERVNEVNNQPADDDSDAGTEKRERIQIVLGKNPHPPVNPGSKKDTTTRTK